LLAPGVKTGLDWLAGMGLQKRMTGSGSAVFAPLADMLELAKVLASAPKGFEVRCCGNLQHHPLAGWA
jgi:4-diphosphocytidyl-2-C-methyl-D-erythritol kinase